jgi:hypothetical protein
VLVRDVQRGVEDPKGLCHFVIGDVARRHRVDAVEVRERQQTAGLARASTAAIAGLEPP